MCPAHVIFPKTKQSPSFSRDLMKKRREKAVLVDRISRWLFPTRFDCCGHCCCHYCDVIAWPTNLLFFLTDYLKCTSSFWKGKRWSELDVDAQSGNFQIVSRISPAPLASYLIFMFKSLAVFCRFSFIHFSFHIFSFILLNIVYWALFGDHDLWWSSIFQKTSIFSNPGSSLRWQMASSNRWMLTHQQQMWLPKIPSLLMFWHQIWIWLWKPLLNIEPTTFQDLKEAPGVPPTKRSSLCRIYSDFISEINSDQSKVNRPNQSRKKSLLF